MGELAPDRHAPGWRESEWEWKWHAGWGLLVVIAVTPPKASCSLAYTHLWIWPTVAISAECLGLGSVGSCFSLSLIAVVLNGKQTNKKKAKFQLNVFKNIFPMFSGSQNNRLLSVYPFQSAALTLWAACHAFTSSIGATSVSSETSPSFNFQHPVDPWIFAFLRLPGHIYKSCFLFGCFNHIWT